MRTLEKKDFCTPQSCTQHFHHFVSLALEISVDEGNITIKILCSSKVQLRSYIPNKIISVFIVMFFSSSPAPAWLRRMAFFGMESV